MDAGWMHHKMQPEKKTLLLLDLLLLLLWQPPQGFLPQGVAMCCWVCCKDGSTAQQHGATFWLGSSTVTSGKRVGIGSSHHCCSSFLG
jgi:hypothetical protein